MGGRLLACLVGWVEGVATVFRKERSACEVWDSSFFGRRVGVDLGRFKHAVKNGLFLWTEVEFVGFGEENGWA